MAVDARINALRAKHQALEQAVEEETHRPLPDSALIQQLKREKLRLKDQIAQLHHH